MVQIEILHPISYDNVKYERGVYQTSDKAAADYLSEELAAKFLALRAPGNRFCGPIPVAKIYEPPAGPKKGSRMANPDARARD